jgi:cell pole-organizing protein PopZ
MHKTLIVANRSVGGDELAEEVRRRVALGDVCFHLVVPVASPVASAVAIGAAVGDAANLSPTSCYEVTDERRVARERLAYGLDWLASLGATATGELSTECDTAGDVAGIVEANHIDDVIVSTLPTTISRWLHQDLPHRIERRVRLPVTVISGTA